MLSSEIIDSIVRKNHASGLNSIVPSEVYLLQNGSRSLLFLTALEASGDTECSAIEIGTYGGDTALLWMELMLKSKVMKPLLTVDAHNIPGYQDYYITSMIRMAGTAYEMFIASGDPLLWRHYPVLDTIFMDHIYETLPFDFFKKYFFVNLDGPHDDESIIKEFVFFYDKLVPGGTIVIDDAGIENASGVYVKNHADNNGDSFSILSNGIALVKRKG